MGELFFGYESELGLEHREKQIKNKADFHLIRNDGYPNPQSLRDSSFTKGAPKKSLRLWRDFYFLQGYLFIGSC
jgi:hypothetical protein